ncbi:hypothetical protein G6F42_029072 [Rhizopus arrhizus]|nr:hypothetical protein G6F42_029072 [Rhizopus arrhizus]
MGPLSCTSREVSSKQKLRNRDSTPQLARVLYQQSYWVYLDLLFGCHSPYLGTPNIWNFETSCPLAVPERSSLHYAIITLK